MPAEEADEFCHNLRAVAKARHHSVVASTRSHQNTAWRRWCEFCDPKNIERTLTGVQGAAHILQVFAFQLRRGDFCRDKQPVLAGTVAAHLSSISKEITRLVEAPHRSSAIQTGSYEHGLGELLRTFAREDPPTDRAWPVPSTLLERLLTLPTPDRWDANQWTATQELCTIAFFFLMRPSEYCYTRPAKDMQTIPHTAASIHFLSGTPPSLTDENDPKLSHAGLTFGDQKNGSKDDKVTHCLSGHDTLCPVRALQARKKTLAALSAGHGTDLPTMDIFMFHHTKRNKLARVTSAHIQQALRIAAAGLEATTGILASKIQARSLRAGGATALLCGKIDKDTIKLLGRWKSDAVDNYLRKNVISTETTYASTMVSSGHYTFINDNEERDLCPDLLPDQLDDELQTAYLQSCGVLEPSNTAAPL